MTHPRRRSRFAGGVVGSDQISPAMTLGCRRKTTTMKITIEVRMDVRAALAAGRLVREWEPVEVSPDGFGECWPALVHDIDMRTTPPRLLGVVVVEPTAEAVVAIYRGRIEQGARADQQQVERIEGMIEGIVVVGCTIGPRIELGKIVGWMNREARYLGIVLSHPDGRTLRAMRNNYGPSGGPAVQSAWVRYQSAMDAAEAEIRIHNDRLLESMRHLWERAMVEAEAKAAADEEKARADEARADAERNARRLATGRWEMETGSYNEKRLGKPWCALVTFPSGPKAQYEFGESSGAWGKAGVMRLQCRPGDVIAWGQRDLRRPDRSEHTLEVMQEDGSMREVSVAEAYKLTRGA